MMSAFEIACFLLLFSAVSLSTAAPEQDGKLHILSLSSDKLRAVYHLSAQEGIEITSQVSEEESHLSITTLAGEQLVSARSVADSSDIFWKIMGYSIFLHNNSLELQDGGTQRDMLEYVVPSTAADHVEKEMKKHHITPKLLRTLNTENVEQTKQSAFSWSFFHDRKWTVSWQLFEFLEILSRATKIQQHSTSIAWHSTSASFAPASQMASSWGRPKQGWNERTRPPSRRGRWESERLVLTRDSGVRCTLMSAASVITVMEMNV